MGAGNEHLTIIDEMLPLQARSTGGTTNVFRVDEAIEALLFVRVTAVSGTTPTLDIKVQTSPDLVNFFDLPAAFATISTVPTVDNPAPLKLLNFGKWIRVKYVIAGTTPSFTFSLHVARKT